MTMRTLLLMRHARSDYPVGVPDRDRPLAPRGERDAAAAGMWLRAAYPAIDQVIVSPARRAHETWMRVAPCLEVGGVQEDARVYDDWGTDLQEVVAGLPDAARSALVIGHNPGIEEFTMSHATSGDPQARERVLRKFPTSAIAVLHLPDTWADAHGCALVTLAVPRG
jgi:phosphohistidine phosphatase